MTSSATESQHLQLMEKSLFGENLAPTLFLQGGNLVEKAITGRKAALSHWPCLTPSPSDLKVHQGKFRLDIRKKFLWKEW